MTPPIEGLTTLQSKFGSKETLERLETEIGAKGMKIFARINHGALAAEVGLALRPTEVVLFGNPRGGTPLMQATQTIGIDLPLKILVWQDALGATWLAYEEPHWLAQRHQIAGLGQPISAMDLMIVAVAAKAAGGDLPKTMSKQKT